MRVRQHIAWAVAGGLLALNGAMAAAVPVSQSFESFTNNHPIVIEPGWSGDAGAGLVTTNETVIDALNDYIGGAGVLPMPYASHEKVLAISNALTNTVASATGGVVVAEWLLLPSHRDTAPVGSDNHQLAFYVSTNSELVVWHRDPDVPTNRWLTLSGNPDISSNDWVRITIMQDYVTDRYQIAVNGTAYTNALGETRAGTNPGSWFHMVQTNGYMSRLHTSGQVATYIDDLVFTNRSLIYSGTSFAEGAANNGSIATTRTITLSGDTFVAGPYSAGTHYSTSGVPSGLTMALANVSPTQVSVSLTGNASPHDAAAGTNAMSLTLEDAIFTLGNADDVTGFARSDLAVSFANPPVLAYDPTTFIEHVANDGSIGNSVTVTLTGDTFTNIATLVAGTHYTTSGVPAGLGVSVVRDNATTLTVSLTGNAAPHGNANDTSMTLTFLNDAFDTVSATNITDRTKSLLIDFADGAALTYSTTTYNETAANDGSLAGGTISLSLFTFAGPVGTNYVLGGEVDVDNLPAGLSVAITKANDYQVTVSFGDAATNHADSNDVSNLTFAFNDAAFSQGNAGAVNGATNDSLVINFNDPPVVTYSGTIFSEASGNNGTIGNSVTATLSGTTLAKSGALAETTDYTVSGTVPGGLAVSITSDGANTLTISLTSAASPHTSAANSSFAISFTDVVFNTVAAANITGRSQSFSVSFSDPPVITYSDTVFSELSGGQIDNFSPIEITISGDTFTGANGSDFVADGKVSTNNVPPGLTLVLTKSSSTKLLATLTGTATAHANSDDEDELTIIFLAGITTADANQVTGYSRTDLEVDFNDSTLVINTLPYQESFEDYADGYAIGNSRGWNPPGAGAVTSETAIVSALTGSFSSFPLVTNRAQVLRISDAITDEIRSGVGDRIYTDVMLYVTPRENPPEDTTGYQFAMFVDTNQKLNVWHCDTSSTPTNTWTTLAGVTVTTGAWHRVTVEKNYRESRFRLYLDGLPTAISNPTSGYDTFSMVSTANAYMSRIRILGASAGMPVYMDDLVVGTQRPDYIPPPSTVFRFR